MQLATSIGSRVLRRTDSPGLSGRAADYPTEQASAAEAAETLETLETANDVIEAAAKILPNLSFF